MEVSERLAALRLIRSENVGPVTYRQLIERFGGASAALDALPELARLGGRRRSLKIHPREAAERELEILEEHGGRSLVLGESAYPAWLAALPDAPPVLMTLGPVGLAERRCVAVVGARNASLSLIHI